MKVTIIKTGEVKEYNAGYALRLLEQGKAKLAPNAAPEKEKATKTAAGSK